MKQRKQIKQYKKELNKRIDFATESFKYWLYNTDLIIDRITIKIWHEYLQDLENLYKILNNKQLHTIQKIKSEWDIINYSFSDLLDNIDAVYENNFNNKKVYNFSDLLRKPILKPTKQNKRKQYKKALNHILSIYKKRINNISNTIAYKELKIDIENITKLIQQNRIKELNIILDNIPFKGFVKDLINWYLYDFDDKYNLVVYDYKLHQIK